MGIKRYSPEGPYPTDGVIVSAEDLTALERKVANCDDLMDAMTEVTAAMSQIPQDIKGLTQVKAWIGNWMQPSLKKLARLTNAGV